MDGTEPRTAESEVFGADAIEQFLIEAYGPLRMRAAGQPLLLRHRRTGGGTIAVEAVYQSAELDFTVEPLRMLVVIRGVTARLEIANQGTSRRYGTGELCIISDPGQPHAARLLPGEVKNCLIDPAELARVAATGPARRPAAIRFTSFDPLTSEAAAHWWSTRAYVIDLLTNPGAAAVPLLLSSAAQLLAAATLATFPNTALTDPTSGDRNDGSTETMRLAIAFIESHAAETISAADIAAATRVTIRAVQLAFRRHLDLTPMDYLRQVRLSLAHDDLQAADPALQTVSAVAFRWGFTSPSRFAGHYRQAYGVPPSQTLRAG